MSSRSKRLMYKPAPAAQTPQLHTARQSLAQGRLSTDANSSLKNHGLKHSPGSAISHNSRARRSLNLSFNSVFVSEENSSNPSSCVAPMLQNSPSKAQPSASLSLSDLEDEVGDVQHLDHQFNPPKFEKSVLAVDATYRHISHTDKEVPIKATYMKSPAKVVCHSPKKAREIAISQAANENTGNIGMPVVSANGNAGKISIPVETVPSFKLSTSLLLKDDPNFSDSSQPKSENESLSTVAGSPVDPRSKAVETVVVQEKGNPRSYVSFLDSGSCTDVSLTSQNTTTNMDQPDLRVSQPNFDDTGFSSLGASKPEGGGEKVLRKKKKKTRVVSSKYMTSAMSRTGGNLPSKHQSKETSQATSRNTAMAGKNEEETSKLSMRDRTINESITTNSQKPLHTSTPADALANREDKITKIQKYERADSSELATHAHLNSKKKRNETKTGKDAMPIKAERTTQVSNKKAVNNEMSQLQHNMIYARLCQWKFLRMKQENAFKKQEKQAQEWFYSMSKLNEQMRERNHELKLSLHKKRKEEEINRQIDLQLKVLRKLDSQIRQLYPEYENFFKGIDATRHHLSFQDILMPQNEDDILDALYELENNAEEVARLLEHDKSKILSFSDEIYGLAEIALAEKDEHERCTELLAAASSLATQENSLKAEIIERKEAQFNMLGKLL
ncbi:uncharacterized protein LOC124443804 [Xenia sp. Carnegie-2017]|uniref:uncharacterized protein LOC124443804 n=1 Tax=Xenia sp. Carnegie-2017 TaxID=2897299 RepID=UPI001F049645|nr:uncharacterized protein LOC124443804 [Xenia sp. Carnegie-2017]